MSKKGKTKKKGQRPTALILIIILLAASNAVTLAYFMVLDDSIPLDELQENYVPLDEVQENYVPFEDVPLSIADVTGENNETYIGQTISVVGTLIYAAGYYILVSNPMLYFNNSLDSRNHITLTTAPTTIASHVGYQVRAKGVLEITDTSDGSMGMGCDSFFDVYTELTAEGMYVDAIEPMLVETDYPFWSELTFPDKYAVLYSGGWKEGKDYYRYWNDIIYMNFILQMHGYLPENIYICYKDGIAEDPYTPVDYSGTHYGMNTVFGILAEEMDARDTLFFYTTNHGGSGGISVWTPMDSTGALTHNQVSGWLDAITCNNMIIVMEQCVSGKFISHIDAPNRVILTACADDESSYSCDTEGNWDEFVYHFMCALVSFSFHDSEITVDADLDENGEISMLEAFIYASINDSRPETPWYNDGSDGVGHPVWDLIDSGWASSIVL